MDYELNKRYFKKVNENIDYGTKIKVIIGGAVVFLIFIAMVPIIAIIGAAVAAILYKTLNEKK